MEYASFHLQHQLQEESAQGITSPPDYKPSTTTSQSWIPNNIYNGSTNSGFLTESFTNSRELWHKHAITTHDSLRISKGQVFDFHNGKGFTQKPASDIFQARIKGEMNRSFSKAMEESCSLISMREPQYSPNFSPNIRVSGEEFFPEENVYNVHKPRDGRVTLTKKNNFGDVSSISNLPTPDIDYSLVSCSLGLNNHQMIDLHSSYNGSCGLQPYNYDNFGLNESVSLSHSNMHGLENNPSNSSSNISSFTREVAMTKRPSNCSLPKESEAKAKKSRPSCPPLKVRKEKLGDRIQTLQRLVAPFGKTSTASVLSEAIGYIHFLHQQIQTLSIPYMKSTQSKTSRMVQLDSNKVDSREFKPDLRSRGLCLVPLSYASFIHRCT
ncbi:hypothetical protein VNO77_02052 [Canavalia gladiata]|uniref:BHLH domain-containing protein n=1 Tax=Canavalia gladiata TaxID=3824 RepID=A0AAN9RAX2_CANGL